MSVFSVEMPNAAYFSILSFVISRHSIQIVGRRASLQHDDLDIINLHPPTINK
jgi:hypothetical protein